MQVGIKGAYDCVKAFSETDLTEDLRGFDVPTLIVHGDDDQIVPIVAAGNKSSAIVKDADYKVYPGAPTASRWSPHSPTRSTPTCWHSSEPDHTAHTPRMSRPASRDRPTRTSPREAAGASGALHSILSKAPQLRALGRALVVQGKTPRFLRGDAGARLAQRSRDEPPPHAEGARRVFRALASRPSNQAQKAWLWPYPASATTTGGVRPHRPARPGRPVPAATSPGAARPPACRTPVAAGSRCPTPLARTAATATERRQCR